MPLKVSESLNTCSKAGGLLKVLMRSGCSGRLTAQTFLGSHGVSELT